eukprot:TRINITY_DN1503_c0_g1_i3.p1 TRINITY_DN1503_c0_g1~~TRINITY_DN1503_c0_g1_i3.p1  ORF type:complete len:434 (+),score=55.32 TRINITY_DN1503_c0_g1_i3:68-1369(+)
MDINPILVHPPINELTTGGTVLDPNLLNCTINPSPPLKSRGEINQVLHTSASQGTPRKRRTTKSETKRTGDREKKTSVFQLGLAEEDRRIGPIVTSIVPTESDVRELSDLYEDNSKASPYPTQRNTWVEDCCTIQPLPVSSEVGEKTVENLFSDIPTDFINVGSFFDTKDVLASDVKIFFLPPEEKESSTFTEQVLDNTYKREENETLPSTTSGVLTHQTHLDGEYVDAEKSEHCKDNPGKDEFVSKENLSLLSLSEIKTLALVCGLGAYGSEKSEIVLELWNVFTQLQDSNYKNFQDVDGRGEQDAQVPPLNLTTLTSQIQTLANYLREDHNCIFLDILEKFFTFVYTDAKRRLGFHIPLNLHTETMLIELLSLSDQLDDVFHRLKRIHEETKVRNSIDKDRNVKGGTDMKVDEEMVYDYKNTEVCSNPYYC